MMAEQIRVTKERNVDEISNHPQTVVSPIVIDDAKQQQQTTENAQKSDDSDDEGNEVLEESPCGRWQKRREQVKQRDVPGIDVAYLAMDTEEGVEVVWNEVQFSERKNFRSKEEKIKAVFDNLTQLDHANLVKFHKWWADLKSDKPRVIFITEYMFAGTMSQFLKRTGRRDQTNKTQAEAKAEASKTLSEKAWKKWCTQILSALSYLHSCDPPIIHGNLTCNTIFIQHNGLIKIGCVAPDAIYHHVKTLRDNIKNMHYIAPEYELGTNMLGTAVDIYAFGICALEMAVLGFQLNGSSTDTGINPELIRKTVASLEDPLQREFIEKCLQADPKLRPKARDLLLHPVLFEVHSLKLLAAHVICNKASDVLSEAALRGRQDQTDERIVADLKIYDTVLKLVSSSKPLTLKEVPNKLELDKFLEDVKNGVYPLTAFAHPMHNVNVSAIMGGATSSSHTNGAMIRAASPADHNHAGGGQEPSGQEPSATEPAPEAFVENRRILNVSTDFKPFVPPAAKVDSEAKNGSGDPDDEASPKIAVPKPPLQLTVLIKFDDKMNRQLTCDVSEMDDNPKRLADELVFNGFIHELDCQLISESIELAITKYEQQKMDFEANPSSGENVFSFELPSLNSAKPNNDPQKPTAGSEDPGPPQALTDTFSDAQSNAHDLNQSSASTVVLPATGKNGENVSKR